MEERVRNVITDVRRKVKYVIYASRKLNRDEMLKEIRFFNYDTTNIRQKSGTEVVIESKQ